MKNSMLTAEEVSATLGMSRAYAYKLIKRLNEEQEARGVLTIPGRISRDYFESRMFEPVVATKKDGAGSVRQ